MRTSLIALICLLSPIAFADVPDKAEDTQPLETGNRIQ
jgi:hypothetical protein